MKYLAEDVEVEGVREARLVQGKEGFSPHGVDVAQSVCGRDLAVGVRGGYDGREEVDRANDGQLIVDAIDGGIIWYGEAHE